MMPIEELIASRRSVRDYQTQSVPKALIQKVIDAGIWAPSSMNRQPWRFVVVTQEEARKTLSEEAKQSLLAFLNTHAALEQYGKDALERFKKRAESEEDTIFYDAPVVIMVIQTKDVGNQFDYGLAVENMLLCAHGNGLGMCPIGLATPLSQSEAAREMFHLQPEEKVIIGLCLGYPNDAPEKTERHTDVVEWVE
ncbi:hypothetical protein COY07_00185 [Candidatus Peregrinibacteria bacterium CG_4_10_14_0_2_um_filter_43_11]|nr:MAG: hypothetical protein COY07_00185 [Candidatus Peregrinibacteria bacterium CG_4_10_14_0_2_um_filter_43_11]